MRNKLFKMIQSVENQQKQKVQTTVYAILFTVSFSHLLNDMLQAIVPSIYPLLKDKFHLTFTQIGFITLTYQLTASILQPFVGIYTDKKPMPNSLLIGMLFTFLGLLAVAFASNFVALLLAVSLIGIGSSIFHPESSRIAHLASGGKKGLAQSIFQLGGNAGSAIGPLLAAIIIAPYTQFNTIYFCIVALLGMFVVSRIGRWYKNHLFEQVQKSKSTFAEVQRNLSKKKIVFSLFILLILVFSKYFYMASMTSYYTFYLIDKFHLSIQQSQVYLFAFLIAVAAGTLFGGSLGDRFGRKYIIWISILGAAPFTLLLPYVDLFWTGVLSVIIGLIISSAFSAILVYATDLVPNKVGLVAGLFFGLAFGMGGLGSAVLGKLADMTDIYYVYKVCSFLPLIGILTAFLPNIERKKS